MVLSYKEFVRGREIWVNNGIFVNNSDIYVNNNGKVVTLKVYVEGDLAWIG